MSDNQKDERTLTMKDLKEPKQVQWEKTETILNRFGRLQHILASLLKGKPIIRGVYRIR
jgi:hypothetical protein